jgi:hypothetical protein
MKGAWHDGAKGQTERLGAGDGPDGDAVFRVRCEAPRTAPGVNEADPLEVLHRHGVGYLTTIQVVAVFGEEEVASGGLAQINVVTGQWLQLGDQVALVGVVGDAVDALFHMRGSDVQFPTASANGGAGCFGPWINLEFAVFHISTIAENGE